MLDRPPRNADRLRADAEPTGVEPLHRVDESHALVAQHVIRREPHIVQLDRRRIGRA